MEEQEERSREERAEEERHRRRAIRSAAAGRGGKALRAFPRALPDALLRSSECIDAAKGTALG